MAYQALARKWRPRAFDQIVGQEHVVRALSHALESGRLHHAYLFTGTRGVGKTTIARILAKAMNCESPQGANPCGQCPACRALDEGRFVDLIEVDAASRTKVEDTRELLDNVLYAPSQGRYKVYIIDEVHMLSGHSFNALLKTLEEPPPHIKFLLATTDPQKIPVTVLSRCLQISLKRLSPEQIRGQMDYILHQEGISFEANAIRALARAADGSLRDGLSLMDQAIVHGGGSLSEQTVSQMLGTVARQPVFEILEAVLAHDAAALLGHIEAVAAHAPNYADMLQQILIILHHAALAQWAPDSVRGDDDAALILAMAQRTSEQDLQLFYQIALVGQRDLPLAPDPRSGFEMVMLRMLAFRPAGSATGSRPDALPPVRKAPALVHTGTGFSVAEPPRQAAAPEETHDPVSQPADAAAVPLAPVARTPESRMPERPAEPLPAAPQAGSDWAAMIRAMGLAAMTRELANNCVLESLDGDVCVLSLEPRLGHLLSPRSEAALQDALRKHLNRPVVLTIRQQAATEETPAASEKRRQDERLRDAQSEVEQDETILALKAQFGARVVPGTVKPIH